MLLELAILKNFDSGTYKAGVQLAGSLTTYFDDVPVSRAIPTSALVIGNRVILAIPGDNPKDACVIAAWPQGNPGGAEVHGNEYHDPDFASEAALAAHVAANTGVHNVGSLYIAKSSVDGLNLASHALRHKWLGDDALNIKDLFFQFAALYYKLWSDLNGFTSLVSGSGSNTPGFSYLTLLTGTTSGSRAGAYATQNHWLSYSDGKYRYRVMARHNPQSTLTNSEYWFGFLNVPTNPSYTQKHVAFQILNGRIWASCGDGTNGTQVDTGVDLGATGTADLYFKYMANDITYYIGGMLKATITTNRPNSFQAYFTTSFINSAAEYKNMLIYPALILIAPD
jgi:hypothetical protein